MPKQFYEIDPSSDFNERIFINLSMFITIESCNYRKSKLFFYLWTLDDLAVLFHMPYLLKIHW
jgi:hypothetical protein